MMDMEVDLTRANAESLQFSARHPLSEALSEKMLDVCIGRNKKREWPQMLASHYMAGDRLHHCSALVSRLEGEFRVSFIYFLSPRTDVRPRGGKKLRELIDCLSEVMEPAKFDCLAVFEYGEGKGESIISLPLKPFAYSPLPFDEIRGLRLSKLREGSAEMLDYSVIIDRPSNRDVHHAITFAFESPYSRQLPNSVLHRAEEISLKFHRRDSGGV